jgi:hypothetical protein
VLVSDDLKVFQREYVFVEEVTLRRRGETTESSGGRPGRAGWGFPYSIMMSTTAA